MRLKRSHLKLTIHLEIRTSSNHIMRCNQQNNGCNTLSILSLFLCVFFRFRSFYISLINPIECVMRNACKFSVFLYYVKKKKKHKIKWCGIDHKIAVTLSKVWLLGNTARNWRKNPMPIYVFDFICTKEKKILNKGKAKRSRNSFLQPTAPHYLFVFFLS